MPSTDRPCTHRARLRCMPVMARVPGPKPETLAERERPAFWIEDRGTVLVQVCLYCRRPTT